MKRVRFHNISIHLLSVLGVVAFEQGTILLYYGKLAAYEFPIYLVQIPFFYLYAHFLLQSVHRRKESFLKVFLLTICWIISFFILQTIVSMCVDYIRKDIFKFPTVSIYYKRFFSRYAYIMALSFAYFQAMVGIRKAKQSREQELRIMEDQRNQAELEYALLRTQINPHLLFNSLQFIEYQVEQNSPKAVRAVQLLGDLMHYSLKATLDNNTVPLQDELVFIKQYLELTHLRSDNQQYLELSVTAAAMGSNLQLPSGILGNFIENMFKHGDLSEVGDPGMAIIELEHERLIVQTHNLKRAVSFYKKTGIGMQNIRKRLDLLYPGRYTLRTTEENNHYNLYLEMML